MNSYTGHLKASIDVASRGHDVVSRARGWLQSLRASLHRNHEHRMAIRELRALSDRQLEDIGVVRAQIPEIVQNLSAHKAAATRSADDRVATASFVTGCCMGHS